MKRHLIRESGGSMYVGQDLIVVGYIGEVGTKTIATERKSELYQRFAKSYVDQMTDESPLSINGNLKDWESFGATECELIGEGGIMTALWNLSASYDIGLEFTLRRIPIRQETIEICEHYALNPYRLMSGNCVLLVSEHGEHMVSELAKQGIHAVVIGMVKSGAACEILSPDGIGYLEKPQKDELKKVVPAYFKKKD